MFAKKPPLWKRIVTILLVIILTLALGAGASVLYKLYIDYLERPADIVDEPQMVDTDVTLESGVTYYSDVTNSHAVFCSSESIKFIDINGKTVKSHQTSVLNPVISAEGEYFLVADKGNKKAQLYKNGEETAVFELPGAIITSRVCQNGLSVFVTKGELHKCSVLVLDSEGAEIFKWNSGNLNVLSADISPDGKEVCVSTINTDEGVIKSNIIMFNTGKDKPFTNDVYDGLVFASVIFEGNYIYAISDAQTYIYNNYGKVLGTIDYSERELITYDCNKNNLTLVFSNSAYLKGGYLVENYDISGNMQGRYELISDIKYLDVFGGNIALNSGTSLMVLDLKCRERKNILLGSDINDFMFFGGETKGVGVSGSAVRIINVK